MTDGRTVKAKFAPLVDEDTFDRVQLVLKGRGHVPTPHRRRNEHFPLRGWVRCRHCNVPLTASFSKGRRQKYPYYHCPNSACPGVNVRKEVLEGEFCKALERVTVESNAVMKLFREMVLTTWQAKEADILVEQGHLADRLKELQATQEVLLDKLLSKAITDELYRRKNDELATEIALLRSQHHDAELDEFNVEAVLNLAGHYLANARVIWEQMDVEYRQRFQKVLFPSGLVYSREEGFGTSATSPITKLLGEIPPANSGMAPPTGFEPVLPG